MKAIDSSGLSTLSTPLSTEIEDNFYLLTSTFTTFPQKRPTPITTIFIYKYLSPQANLLIGRLIKAHSAIRSIYVKLSNLEGVGSQMDEMRASA
jgi:hypothetical protein